MNLNVELKSDDVQSFNTRWDETIISMKKQPDDEHLQHLYYRQLQQSEQVMPLLSLCIPGTVQKGESQDHTRLKQMVVRCMELNTREKHFFSRERQLEKPAFSATAAKGKSKAKAKNILEIAYNGRQKVKALEVKRCGLKHDTEKRRESKGKGKGSRSS